MFKVLGVLLACYVVRCLIVGDVYGRAGWRGKVWTRSEEPTGYYAALGGYSALVLMLFFLF